MHTQWFHNYSAIGNSLGLTALVVSTPILFLFWALSFKKMKGHIAGTLTLVLTLLVTTVAYQMPVSIALSAAVLGMLNGLFQIGWIILSAVFLYNITVESGQLEIIKGSVSLLSTDRRIQAILIAFCFSAFMEGTTGMGAPVAVCAAMLIGIGFPPLPAALICLAGNTQSVPFGTAGVPTIMMSSVTGISDHILARAVGNDVVVLALIIPMFVVVVLVGLRSAMAVLPAALVAGVTYAITCYAVIRVMGAELPSILSSFVSMTCLILFLKFWRPKSTWRFTGDPEADEVNTARYTTGAVMKAWSPFIILMIVMCVWSLPAFKDRVSHASHWVVNIPSWPFLDGIVYRTAPIVSSPAVYAASYRWEFGTAAGTGIFLSALIFMALARMSPATGARVLLQTFKQMKFALLTLAAVIGIAFVANYSGMSFTLALALAHLAGGLFPVISPVIGWFGVFLTGSVTSSSVLLGKLQQVSAMQIGVNPVLTTSANLAGSMTGKLISPQSLAIACAATGMTGRESDIFRNIWKYSVLLLGIIILLIVAQAYLVPGLVPSVAPGTNIAIRLSIR